MAHKFSTHNGLCALCCMLICTLGQAQEVNKATASAADASASVSPTNSSSPNVVTRALVGRGVLKCASRVEQVSNFLGFGPTAGAMLLPAQQDVDNRLAHVMLESPTPEGSAYVSATFAPNQSNGCGATYDAVMYWSKGCDAVATQQFDKLKRVGPLKKDILVMDGGVATKVFLMTAGNGCVSIKKEVVL